MPPRARHDRHPGEQDDEIRDSGERRLFLDESRVLRSVRRALVVVWLVLAVGAVFSIALRTGLGRDNVFGLVPFFNLNEEGALGTWVASVLLLACGLLAMFSALLSRDGRQVWQRNWWVLAAVFVLLALDEVARIHDRISPPLQQILGTSGVLYFAWVIPVVALGLAFLLYQLRFLRHLGRTGLDLFAAGVVYVAGAAGFEMAQGLVRSDTGDGSAWDVFPLCEELLEFAGTMWALLILLRYLLVTLPRAVTLQVGARRAHGTVTTTG